MYFVWKITRHRKFGRAMTCYETLSGQSMRKLPKSVTRG